MMYQLLYDNDMESYIIDRVLDLNEFFKDQPNHYNQRTLVFKDLKTVDTLKIENLKHKDLLISLIKCELKKIEITDTCINRLKITNDDIELFNHGGVPYNPQIFFELEIRSSNIKILRKLKYDCYH